MVDYDSLGGIPWSSRILLICLAGVQLGVMKVGGVDLWRQDTQSTIKIREEFAFLIVISSLNNFH